MMKNFEYDGEFCCATMTHAQRDPRWMVDYDDDFKTHFIVMLWPGSDQLHFSFCPWCGKNIRPAFLDEPDAE